VDQIVCSVFNTEAWIFITRLASAILVTTLHRAPPEHHEIPSGRAAAML
jgi:hypothetical protein